MNNQHASGSSQNVDSRVSAIEAWQEGHEKLCTERHSNVILNLGALKEGHLDIVKQLRALGKAGWGLAGSLLVGMVGLLGWFFLQVWPVQARVEQLSAELPSRTANRYTSTDAETDREHYQQQIADLKNQLTRLQDRQRQLTQSVREVTPPPITVKPGRHRGLPPY